MGAGVKMSLDYFIYKSNAIFNVNLCLSDVQEVAQLFYRCYV